MTTRADITERLVEEARALRQDAVLTALTGLGLAVGVAAELGSGPGGVVTAAYLLAYLAGGLPPAMAAARELRRARLDIDLLMVLAALAAAAVGEARDGAVLLFLFSLAGTLEDYAMGNTRRAVAALMRLRPDEATVVEDGVQRVVPVEQVPPGTTVLVRPGERIPVDGVVVAGVSAVDQAPITGESVPVDKEPGSQVFAGTVNGHGALEVRSGKAAGETTLARMIELVTEAQAQRSPSERFSDWFGQRYTVWVLLGSVVALAVFLLTGLTPDEAFYKAATLLVVASPCAVVISVPAAVLSALASSARQGVLFKGGGALEEFGNVELIAFDKTGTLTEGRMEVSDVAGFGGDQSRTLEVAMALELHSEHPIAQSIVAEARERGLEVPAADGVTALPGRGLEGGGWWAGNRRLAEERGVRVPPRVEAQLSEWERDGKTTVLVGGEEIIGAVAVADVVRGTAGSMLAALGRLGVKRAAMLTGDNRRVAQAVGRRLGLAESDVFAELLPQDKVRLVGELRKAGRLAFVGDGVNDAAALVAADVGVAMGTVGSDAALEAADVALLSDDLTRLPFTLELARRTNRIIRQNLTFALGIMAVMVVITLFWHLPLPLGVLGHEGGTLLVVANGLRLLAHGRSGRGRARPAATRAGRVGERARR